MARTHRPAIRIGLDEEPATEGCCRGHRCDHCLTCRQGTCCGRDYLGYRLPDEGSWNGGIIGRLGVLNDDGDKLECHICGEWWRHLGHHVAGKHGVTADEYRALFGLSVRTGLANHAIRAKRREVALAIGLGQLAKGHDTSTWTPEQRALVRKRTRPVSTEARNGQAWQEGRERNKAHSHARWQDPEKRTRYLSLVAQYHTQRVEVACVICGATKRMTPADARNATAHLCGASACKSEWERRRIKSSKLHTPETWQKLSDAKRGICTPAMRAYQDQRLAQRLTVACAGPDCTHTRTVKPSVARHQWWCSRTCQLAYYRASPTCVHGHPWTEENTYWYTKPNGNVYRYCRVCSRAVDRASKARRRLRDDGDHLGSRIGG